MTGKMGIKDVEMQSEEESVGKNEVRKPEIESWKRNEE